MNQQTLLRSVSDIDERFILESEDIIRFKRASVRRRRMKYISLTFVMFLFAMLPFVSEIHPENADDNGYFTDGVHQGTECAHVELYMNSVSHTIQSDMDVRITTPVPLAESFLADRKARTADESYNLLSASVPEGFFYNGMCVVEAPVMKGMVKRYVPHDRIYEFYDGDKILEIKVCDFEEPLSDCIIVSSEEVLSEIGTEEVLIKKLNSSYYAEFEKNGIYYDITSHNLSSDEFTAFLVNLIMPGGMND